MALTYPDLAPVTRRVVRTEAPVRATSTRAVAAMLWRRFRWTTRFATLILLLAVWEVATASHWIAPTKLPSPASVWHGFVVLVDNGQLQSALWSSVQRVVKGLAVGGGIGLVLGLISGLSRFGETLLDAPLQAIRMLPVLVMMYFFILWLGTGTISQVAVIALATFFPLYLNTFAGVRNVDQRLVEAGRAFGLRRFSLLRKVIFPGALPIILTGLRQALGVAWFALIFAETVNTGSGIGALILNAENVSLQVNVMVVGLLLYAAIGLIADLLVRLIEKGALSWRTSFQGV